MPVLNLKPNHKIIRAYYQAVAESGQLSLLHEGAVAPHFAALLRACASQVGWSLQEQYPIPRKGQHPLRADGALLDLYSLRHGIWEAKDGDDDLRKEARAKFKQGYPSDNILFQSPARAILYQDGRETADEDITDPERLVSILRAFFGYEPPAFEQWERAVAEFKDRVPELAQSLLALIEQERKENPRFVAAFDDFAEVARQAVNPNISVQAVEEMLIQHLLTERIFRKVFNNPDFAQRNVIAREIEKVIAALTSRSFSRTEFLGRLDRFYVAIETTAATIDNYREKQSFLNTVYEQFFQGFSVKVADTHGIVYTPQSVVDFMVRSVDDILRREFGKGEGLASDGVAILDPFVGTGNFILRVMREMPRTRLPGKYRAELFCNEVMLLPYYIASMNIEHEYYDLTGGYESFEGISLVDTFELAESRQMGLFVKENTQRVQRQKDAPIFVIIGNPPYNAWQVNENDNSRNRKYPVVDKRVAETYTKDSTASNKNPLSDVYVKAIRWATDRLSDSGVVAFVTNNSFIDNIAFDGMRAHLHKDFNRIYILDLQGNVRKDSMRDGIPIGEEHTVFGLSAMVGISIAFFVMNPAETNRKIFYSTVDRRATRIEKFALLEKSGSIQGIDWIEIEPDQKHTWLTEGLQSDFEEFIPIGLKTHRGSNEGTIFSVISNGVKTNRDTWAYNFIRSELKTNIKRMLDAYNQQAFIWQRVPNKPTNIEERLDLDDKRISWSSGLKNALIRHELIDFNTDRVRRSLYRPFTNQWLYFDKYICERRYQMPRIFPNEASEQENLVFCLSDRGHREPFSTLVSNFIPELHVLATKDGFQCFPYYTYDEDGRNRRENITDWALERFRETYRDTRYEIRDTSEEIRDTKYEIRDTSEEAAPNSNLVSRISYLVSRKMGHFSLHLRPAAPSCLSRDVCRQFAAGAAAHPVRARLLGLRAGRGAAGRAARPLRAAAGIPAAAHRGA